MVAPEIPNHRPAGRQLRKLVAPGATRIILATFFVFVLGGRTLDSCSLLASFRGEALSMPPHRSRHLAGICRRLLHIGNVVTSPYRHRTRFGAFHSSTLVLLMVLRCRTGSRDIRVASCLFIQLESCARDLRARWLEFVLRAPWGGAHLAWAQWCLLHPMRSSWGGDCAMPGQAGVTMGSARSTVRS